MKVRVLSPVAASVKERTSVYKKLANENIAAMQGLIVDDRDEKVREWQVKSTASLLYFELTTPPYHKTLDELHASLKTFDCLDEAIALLKSKKVIQERFVEFPDSDSATV